MQTQSATEIPITELLVSSRNLSILLKNMLFTRKGSLSKIGNNSNK